RRVITGRRCRRDFDFRLAHDPGSCTSCDVGRVVARAVVDDDDLERFDRLTCEESEAHLELASVVTHGDHDRGPQRSGRAVLVHRPSVTDGTPRGTRAPVRAPPRAGTSYRAGHDEAR